MATDAAGGAGTLLRAPRPRLGGRLSASVARRDPAGRPACRSIVPSSPREGTSPPCSVGWSSRVLLRRVPMPPALVSDSRRPSRGTRARGPGSSVPERSVDAASSSSAASPRLHRGGDQQGRRRAARPAGHHRAPPSADRGRDVRRPPPRQQRGRRRRREALQGARGVAPRGPRPRRPGGSSTTGTPRAPPRRRRGRGLPGRRRRRLRPRNRRRRGARPAPSGAPGPPGGPAPKDDGSAAPLAPSRRGRGGTGPPLRRRHGPLRDLGGGGRRHHARGVAGPFARAVARSPAILRCPRASSSTGR
jgi:hypothetical protein